MLNLLQVLLLVALRKAKKVSSCIDPAQRAQMVDVESVDLGEARLFVLLVKLLVGQA